MSRINLFVVDDDPFVRTSLARRLRRDGFTVREFDSGESVVRSLHEDSEVPDVILLDYKMSGIDGLAAAQLVHNKFPQIPLILLTAYSEALDREEARRNGVLEILTKMVDLDNLRFVIYKAVKRSLND